MTRKGTTSYMTGRRFTVPGAANDDVEWIPYAELPGWWFRWILIGAQVLFRSRENEIEARRSPIVRYDFVPPEGRHANRNLVLMPPDWTREDFHFWLNARRQSLRRRESADVRLELRAAHRDERARLDALERWAAEQFRRREG